MEDPGRNLTYENHEWGCELGRAGRGLGAGRSAWGEAPFPKRRVDVLRSAQGGPV